MLLSRTIHTVRVSDLDSKRVPRKSEARNQWPIDRAAAMCEGARYEWEGRDAGIRTKLADGRRPLWRIVARGSAAREAARARLSARRPRYRDRGDRGGLARRSLFGAARAVGPVARTLPLLRSEDRRG